MASLASVPDTALPIHRGQRVFARARLNLAARLVTVNGIGSCTLLDMSRSGAKIAAEECPRTGAIVSIDGLPMELFGTVRWVRRGLFGVEFDCEASQEQVIAMRRHADGEADRQRQAHISYVRTWVQGPK